MACTTAAVSFSRTGRESQRYTSNGCRQVVGCIPYRCTKNVESCSSSSSGGYEEEDIQVLLVSSQKSTKMMFPKGGWELDETLEQAAIRESVEEAGVFGNIGSQLGEWNFISNRYNTIYVGYMYPLLVTEQLDFWPEKHVRQRTWMSVREAKETCQHGWMKHALDRLVSRLTLQSNSFSTSSQYEEHLLLPTQ